ncbi:MAG: D-sedoheptulose 7-phosphate isomerase [Candidatus Latescibacterota bacterium]|nr:MAG: D-sedoheptulose 7-phosphate isomerase [Candidatus Latescibacterota bacterium]
MRDGTNALGSQIAAQIQESIEVKQRTLDQQIAVLTRAAEILIAALRAGQRVLFCGNGGSAADSQHIAAELVGRFRRERAALPAIALTTDTSILTALANDYSYADVFSRQVEALGRPGDVLVGISTSGNSPNVLAAVRTAQAIGMATIGLTGEAGGELRENVDVCFCAPSTSTSHIQEAHITVAHALCELIERELFEVVSVHDNGHHNNGGGTNDSNGNAQRIPGS